MVVVAEVPVAFLKVKFWRVVEPETKRSPEELIEVVAVPPTLKVLAVKTELKRLVEVPEVPEKVERVVRPVTFNVPVKLAADEIVWPLMRPEVIVPRVALPVFNVVEKRLVEEATEEKMLVVVAEVVVLRLAINPPVKVDEAVEINPLSKPIVVEVETP